MIVDIDEVRQELGVLSGGEDAALLARVHRRVERLVKDFVGYEVEHGTQVEILPSDDRLAGSYDPLTGYGPAGPDVYGSEIIFLRHLPVRSVTFVEQDDTGRWEGSEYTLDATSYRLDLAKPGLSTSGRLIAASGWSLAPNSLRITYVAGWTADELADVASVFPTAVLQACQQNYNQAAANRAARITAGTGAVQSETLDGQTFQYARAAQNHGFVIALPESVQRMLMPHVNLMRKCLT